MVASWPGVKLGGNTYLDLEGGVLMPTQFQLELVDKGPVFWNVISNRMIVSRMAKVTRKEDLAGITHFATRATLAMIVQRTVIFSCLWIPLWLQLV